MKKMATLAERNAGKLTPIPVYDRPSLRKGARVLGYARTEAGARRVLTRHGIIDYVSIYESNARPPQYMPIFRDRED